jgi:hypothetical protein
MRSLFLGIGILAAAMTMSVQPGEAAERAFCLGGNKANGGMPECIYYTWEQCRNSVSGSDYCYANPWFTGSARTPQGRGQANTRRQSQNY